MGASSSDELDTVMGAAAAAAAAVGVLFHRRSAMGASSDDESSPLPLISLSRARCWHPRHPCVCCCLFYQAECTPARPTHLAVPSTAQHPAAVCAHAAAAAAPCASHSAGSAALSSSRTESSRRPDRCRHRCCCLCPLHCRQIAAGPGCQPYKANTSTHVYVRSALDNTSRPP
jgi:hypothetical protein